MSFFWFLWFFVQELPKAQLAVVLVLKRLRRRVHGLKSHPTDWEKPGIEPATPGLQDIGLFPTPRRELFLLQWFICKVDKSNKTNKPKKKIIFFCLFCKTFVIGHKMQSQIKKVHVESHKYKRIKI